MKVHVRQLSVDDADAYRVFRLQALQQEPSAFGDTFEEASKRPQDHWSGIFDGKRIFFGAFANGELVGSVNIAFNSGSRVEHKVTLLGMYVESDTRSKGVGTALVLELQKFASGKGVATIQLTVNASNIAAIRFYESLGYSAFGHERRAYKIDGAYADAIHMAKDLDDPR
jgi:RimJ/RimL family protein N-acetyltransferase